MLSWPEYAVISNLLEVNIRQESDIDLQTTVASARHEVRCNVISILSDAEALVA